MSKLIKRLIKTGIELDNALVIGEDVVPLEDLISKFKTVFVVSDTKPKIRASNLIYRSFESDLNILPSISVFFIKEEYNSSISKYLPYLTKSKATLVIWNSNNIEKEKLKPLLNYKYKRISKQYEYHFWKPTA